jgi:hypothetical protein
MKHHAPADRSDVVYARAFQRQQEGHFLYPTLTAKQLHPGSCGYFDSNGDWQMVTDLKLLLPNLQVRETSGAQWPLRLSKNISKVALGGNAGVSYVITN